MGEGEYENPWLYQGTNFTSDDIDDFFGFVYCITNNKNGRQYIGRKYFWKFRTPKGKKRKVKSESDWKKYYGSCPELKEEIQQVGRHNFSRVMLSLHKTAGKTNFEETRQLFVNGVLTESLDDGTPKYYNSNILSRYFRKDYLWKLDTTDEIVAHAREWAIDRVESAELVGDKIALYAEFEDWIELDDVENIEIISIEKEPENEDRI